MAGCTLKLADILSTVALVFGEVRKNVPLLPDVACYVSTLLPLLPLLPQLPLLP